jgi:hypothetical protein
MKRLSGILAAGLIVGSVAIAGNSLDDGRFIQKRNGSIVCPDIGMVELSRLDDGKKIEIKVLRDLYVKFMSKNGFSYKDGLGWTRGGHISLGNGFYSKWGAYEDKITEAVGPYAVPLKKIPVE